MPNSNKHPNRNFQTPVSDNSDKSFYTPDRNTPKEEWKIIEVKTATKTTFTIPELNARIHIETHRINSNQKKTAKKPSVILEKACASNPGDIIINDDTRYGDPHAIAVVKTRSYDDENNDELLARVANCLIRLHNIIQRIITINRNSANSKFKIRGFEEKTRINHVKALGYEIKALETALEHLKGDNPSLAEKIKDLVNEKILDYESYKNLACSTPTSQKNTDPYAPFEILKVPSSLSDRVRIGHQEQFPFPNINFDFEKNNNLERSGNSYLPCRLFGDNPKVHSDANKENNHNNSNTPF